VNRTRRVLPILTAILAAGIGGYWLGHHGLGTSELMTTTGAAQTNASAPSGPVIYTRTQTASRSIPLNPNKRRTGGHIAQFLPAKTSALI
jgi:hypothetical protein